MSVNFAQQTYDWYSIPSKASTYVNPELGKINFHAGVAVSMYWGPNGSGSQTQNIVTALENYFKYSTSTQHVSKSSYTETNWKNLIKAQIDSKKPVVYSGSSTTTGHAWNCDGYQDDSFHMNWGWGGAGNGYYTLDNLTSSATPGGPENNFNQGQDMVINIFPRENYPAYCPGTKIITGLEGSFDDGSSITNYQANANCIYVINPTCGASVQLNFDDFDLAAGDEVKIYNGDENSTELIASFDIDNTPGTDAIYGTKGAMTIKFTSDGSAESEGWNIKYSVKNCRSNILYEEASGSFTDGSGTCDYSNSTVCSWIIEPDGVNYIDITFDDFDLAAGSDYVKICKESLTTANTIATLTNASPPTGTIRVSHGKAVVQFFADANNVSKGWSLNYTSGQSSIDQNRILSDVSILPNPGNINSRLVISLNESTNTKIMITNLLGEIIAYQEYELVDGVNQLFLKDISKTTLIPGVYFISVGTGTNMDTQKFVVTE